MIIGDPELDRWIEDRAAALAQKDRQGLRGAIPGMLIFFVCFSALCAMLVRSLPAPIPRSIAPVPSPTASTALSSKLVQFTSAGKTLATITDDGSLELAPHASYASTVLLSKDGGADLPLRNAGPCVVAITTTAGELAASTVHAYQDHVTFRGPPGAEISYICLGRIHD